MIPRNVTVTVLKDDVAEPALHRTQVLHSVRSSPKPAYSALNHVRLSSCWATSDGPHKPELSLREGAPARAYSLRLASRPWAPVEVQIGASSEVAASHQRVLIQPDKWDSPHLVSVTAVDGASVEWPNPRISALAHWLTSEDPAYDGLAAPSLLVRVWDATVRPRLVG